MDKLTFISNLIGDICWPSVVAIGLVIFRRPISNVISSLRKIKYKDFEAELEEADIAPNPEINILISYLTRSAHSFQWFRDHTELKYSDDRFNEIISKNPELIKKVTIIKRDEEGNRIYPGLQGMKLTQEATKRLN